MTTEQAPTQQTTRQLLIEWERRCRRNIDTHAWAERRFDRLNMLCAVASIGSLVALGVIAAGFDLTKGNARYWVVALSVLAALTSVLLVVRDYASQAAAHRIAARQYGALRREIEVISLTEQMAPGEVLTRIGALQKRWDWAADLAPNAPKSIREKADKISRERHYV
jgi:hypothetical protein